MKSQKSRFEISRPTEKFLKNIALVLGVASAVAAVFDAYPHTMFLSFPFCLIWIYCGWLHTEPRLKWINAIFWAFMGLALCVILGGHNLVWHHLMCRLADWSACIMAPLARNLSSSMNGEE